MPEPDAIDLTALATLREITGGDAAFLVELIDAYFADTPRLLATMRQALATGDACALRRAAHTLKGSSGSFGALRLASLCRDLEARAGAGAFADARNVLAQVEAEYARGKPALTAARTDEEPG
jgi:HPt (histidine-containing phosphotransfer) domain-containing protein